MILAISNHIWMRSYNVVVYTIVIYKHVDILVIQT